MDGRGRGRKKRLPERPTDGAESLRKRTRLSFPPPPPPPCQQPTSSNHTGSQYYNVNVGHREDPWEREPCGRPCAFVVTLFGHHPGYCLDAAVLGYSIRRTDTVHSMVLLHTKDVDRQWLEALRQVGWETRQCAHVECKSLYDGSQNNRFAGTFTKLQAISLTEFYKVLLLDADVIIRRNVDHLFDRVCPAAFRRHAGADTPDGAWLHAHSFYDVDRLRLKGGINAGVILLKTSNVEFKKIMDDLGGAHPMHMKSGMPEQDYLTRWYKDWGNMHVRFNFQPHQVAFIARDRRLLDCTRLSTNYARDVAIVHFSALPKPRDKLFEKTWSSMNDRDFLHDVIFASYLRLLGKERKRFIRDGRKNKEFQKLEDVVKVVWKLEDDTIKSGLEWLRLYKDLLGVFERAQWKCSLPPYRSFRGLVDTAAEQYPHGGPEGTKEEYWPVEEDVEDLRRKKELALRRKIRRIGQELQKLKGGGSLDDRGRTQHKAIRLKNEDLRQEAGKSCSYVASTNIVSRGKGAYMPVKQRGHFEWTQPKVIPAKEEEVHQHTSNSRW